MHIGLTLTGKRSLVGFAGAALLAMGITGCFDNGGGNHGSGVTTGPTGPITLPTMTTVPSRIDGVAPLSVFFDATATRATSTSNPFHELRYSWDFGDPGSGTWRYGSKGTTSLPSSLTTSSRNSAEGAIAAHVFETPGIYTVTLSVTDGTNTVTDNSIQITVQDPNTVFAGAATRCYTQGPVSAGVCPGGGTEITGASFDFNTIVNTDLTSGRRLLFARGETWTTSGISRLEVNGPWTIGAYGAGAKPIIQYGTGSKFILAFGTASSDFKDARVMDLEIKDTGTNNVIAIFSGGTFDQVTILRTDINNTHYGFDITINGGFVRPWDQLTIADSTIGPLQTGSGANAMFLWASRNAILGNFLDNQGGAEHVLRSMYFNKLVVSNNTLSRPAPSKHNITLRAPDWGTATGPIPPNTYSQYAIISDNEIVGGVGVSIAVNTSSDGAFDARTRHIVFERNWWHSNPGAGSSFNALRLNSDFSAIRNNVFDLSGIATTGDACIEVRNNGGTSPNPTTNWIYNNTCYSTTVYTGPGFPLFGVNLDSTAINTTVKNNLVYTPAVLVSNAVKVVADAGSGTIGASGTFGNSSDAQAISGATFTSLASPFTPSGAKPISGYVVGGGVDVPGKFVDFFLQGQPTTPDIGAVFH